MATTRLRKTFKYPSEDEDSDGSRDELDEEEQEALVSSLRTKEAEQNAQYNLIFSILPLMVVLPFLMYLPSCTPRTALFCLLAVTSLCSTAFIMRYLPLDSLHSRSRTRQINIEIDGPVEMYLPYLNGAISGLLLLASWSLKRRSDSQEGLWAFLLLPAIVFAMVMIARKSMADVEAGITQLDGMNSTAALERRAKANTLPLRTGALAIKKGMTAIYDTETGKRTPCTVLQLDRVQVVSHKTRKKHGYYAVCVGSGWKSTKNTTKPMLGHFSVQGVSPKRHLHEFRVADHTGLLAVGEEIRADWFMEGQYVDTRSNCKGKGFQGVMKRWGMHGQDRSHGASLSHRSLGSAGQGQGGGSRVYPGKKMAGNMGGQRNTVQSLKVLQTDREKGLVVVTGAVSGPKGCLVMLSDAIKKPWPQVPPSPKPAEVNIGQGVPLGAKVDT